MESLQLNVALAAEKNNIANSKDIMKVGFLKFLKRRESEEESECEIWRKGTKRIN